MTNVIGIAFITLGLVFDFFGCLGLVRLPDLYNRLQASTKCVTLGTCSILFGIFIMVGFTPAGVKSLMCIAFLIITAPVSAHVLARGAHRSGVELCKESVVDQYKEDGELK